VKTALTILTVVTLAMTATAGKLDPRPADPAATEPVVRIALLLDTSNSMDGLISQAKRHLWSVVNTFAAARYDGQTPRLEVALFEYGNDRLPAHQGYIRCVLPLTHDLDMVSQKLFELTTNGGSEYCGQVIDTAVRTLNWDDDEQDGARSYRAVFIAGNEPFTQGPIHFRSACEAASRRGVRVNTIHCGGYDVGVAGAWQLGAQAGGGSYLNIDQDRVEPIIHAPQDEKLWKLNQQLNETYLWYGQLGAAAATNQVAQDSNAQAMAPSAMAQRVAAKSGTLYEQADRDLVDAVRADDAALEAVAEAELPEPMREMTPEQRQVHVQEQAAKRAEIQAQIAELTQQREAFIARQQAEQSPSGEAATLGEALVAAVREQLAADGWTLEP
jgi:hypothetical protein